MLHDFPPPPLLKQCSLEKQAGGAITSPGYAEP